MATVLIVDDSKTSRKILKNILAANGYEVVGEAADGEEGFLRYRELRPDIVTMDITMPRMDGIESLSIIRKEDKDARVVMITAAGQKEKMIDAVKRGAAEFITKPFDPVEIIEVLKRISDEK